MTIDNSNFINVIGTNGEVGSVPPQELDKYLNSGFKQASPEDLQNYVNKEKYGSTGQQLLGAAEQVASGLSLHGSELAETKLGLTTPEDIEGRKEQLGTPLSMTSQGAGLLLGSVLLPGEGAIGALGKVGEVVGEAVGLGAEGAAAAAVRAAKAAGATAEEVGAARAAALAKFSTTQKIGSAALKAGTENALYQASEEGVHAGEGQPIDFTNALSNVGMAFAIGAPFGAGLGAVHPLWKSAKESEMGQFLKGVQEKLGGVENPALSKAEDAFMKAGVSFSPEAAAVVSRDPYFDQLAQPLLDSQTGAGKNFQKALTKTKSEVSSGVLESVGKTSGDIESLADFSENKVGEELKSKLSEQIKKQYEPIKRSYDEIAEKYAKAEFNQGDRAVLAENLAQKASEEGWVLRPSSPEAKFMNSALKEISVIDNLNKLRTFESSLANEATSMDRYDIARSVRELFGNAEDTFVRGRLGAEAPDLLAKHDAVSTQYKQLKNVISELSDRLKPGKSEGPGTFLYKLNDMVPEQVLSRLAQKKDASFIEFLNQNFPEIQKSINDYQLNKILKASTGSEGLDSTKFFKRIKDLSPELRDSIIAKTGQGRLQALSEVWDGLHHIPRNYSNTAATLDKMWRYKTASAMAMLYDLAKKSPLVGALIGQAGEIASRDVPDAVRLGLIKFLGSNKEISSSGFKSMVEFIDHSIKGENLIRKTVKNLFESGKIALPSGAIPTEKDRKKLDKLAEAYQKNPDEMMNVGGHLGHYLEDQAVAQASALSNAVQMINALRPVPLKQSPLDTESKISKIQQSEFNRTLDIAQQPLMPLQYIKDGTLKPQDIQTLQAIHPMAYPKLMQKITNEMTNHLSDGGKIPYHVRQSLSLFMGQPLDSTLTPQSILAAQSTFMPSPMAQGQKPHKPAVNSFKKLAGLDQTPLQKREASKVTG